MKTIITLLTTLLLSSSAIFAGEGWLTEIEKGVEKAKKENKSVLVEFTGSDWCPPCKMMHKNVFSKEAFVKKASEDFVLVVIDIPRSDKELTEKNQKVMTEWNVRGVPTVILLDGEGEEYHRFTASQYNSVEKFVKHIKSAAKTKSML